MGKIAARIQDILDGADNSKNRLYCESISGDRPAMVS